MAKDRYPALGQQSKELTADKVSERNAKIWQTIADSYGARWNKSYGDLPPNVWCQLFDSLTNQQVQVAIPKLLENYPHHPPTLGEFYEIARIGIALDKPLRDKTEPEYSMYHKGANKVMLRIVMAVGGVQPGVCLAMLAEKARLVSQYEVMAADDHVEWEKFIDVMDERLTAVMKEAQAT